VVRVSGPAVADVLRLILVGFSSQSNMKPRFMTRANAVHPMSGELIDDLLYCFFPGPKSYTGEDLLELFPHGNPILVRQLVEAVRSVPGVRLALPGEFTRRAFEAGKLDLVQAEAIGQLLHATMESSLTNARKLLQGKLSGKIHDLTAAVKRISAMLELEVDFAEEEADADQAGWLAQVQDVQERILDLMKCFRSQALTNRTPSVVFYGAPNAGKSSLVNALLQDDRLLVSPRAGTTRDVVEVLLLLDQGEVRLLDTAGISEHPVDELDAASQVKARATIGQGDLPILLLDASLLDAERSEAMLAEARAQGHWVLWTKADLCKNKSAVPMLPEDLLVSAQNGQGIPELLQRLGERLFPPHESAEEFWITSERQQDSLREAAQSVAHALAMLQLGRQAPEELAFELALVRKSLESITGQISTDDILDVIFRGFCIGK